MVYFNKKYTKLNVHTAHNMWIYAGAYASPFGTFAYRRRRISLGR